METHQYNIDLTWVADRIGIISSPELHDKLEVATPPEFPKGIEGVWSPEHLFTAAVSSCFMTTFLAIAENSDLDYKSLYCPAKGILSREEGKFVMSQIILEPVLTINNEDDREKALKVLIKAERACLISNSITSEVVLKPAVIVEEIIAV